MYFKSKSLCEYLNQYQKIIIYGTGNYAHAIYPQLVKAGLKKKILCFTQTRSDGRSFIDGIPVLNVETLVWNESECVVLVAVSKLYMEEISKGLVGNINRNIVFLTDYQQSAENFSNLTSFQEYCIAIADWYVETGKGEYEKEAIARELLSRGEQAGNNKTLNLVVMICGNISARTTKIAGALTRKNFEVIILEYSQIRNTWFLKELDNIKIIRCSCIEELFFNILQYDPLVYFYEPRWGDCFWGEILLKQKQYFGKIIVSLYDVLNDGYCNETEAQLKTERYALENSDGIVWRWFSKDYLEKKGFVFQGRSIQFLDYCSHENRQLDITYDSDSDIIKLCVVVGYGDNYVERRLYPAQYSVWARIEEILEKIGNRSDCILHFYSGSLNNENIKRCVYFEQQYDNFKFFLGTEHNELLRKLTDYDFGCLLYTDGEEPLDEDIVEYYKGSYHRNGISNVFFDYIGSGVPVITTFATKMWEYLADYDIVIKMRLSDLDMEFLKQNRTYYKERVKEAAKELDIDNYISRLIGFFKEV